MDPYNDFTFVIYFSNGFILSFHTFHSIKISQNQLDFTIRFFHSKKLCRFNISLYTLYKEQKWNVRDMLQAKESKLMRRHSGKGKFLNPC